jgi:hypothetical protein
MEEVDESRGSQGSYFDKTQNRHVPLLPPTTPLLLVRATRLRIGLRFGRKTVQNHASPFNYTERRRGRGNDVGPTRQRQKQTTAPFQFPFIVLLHSRGAFFNLQPSSPSSTSILVANFIPHRLQLQSSLPTSSFVANFSPRRLQLQPSSPFNFQTPSLFYLLPFSLMPAVCLMQLLPNELVTQIIIHSIKDKPIFHFLNLHKKSVVPSGASATPMRYYCTCRCVIFVGCTRIATSGRALSDASGKPIIRRHYASRGCRG